MFPRGSQPVLVTLLICAAACRGAAAPNDFAESAGTADAGQTGSDNQKVIGDYGPALNEYVRRQGKLGANDFCIVAQAPAGGEESAWMIWTQGNKIMLWEGQLDLDQSRRIIDLSRDVVDSESEINGSTYLVTREWVSSLRQRCEREGTKVQIKK